MIYLLIYILSLSSFDIFIFFSGWWELDVSSSLSDSSDSSELSDSSGFSDSSEFSDSSDFVLHNIKKNTQLV